MTTYIVVIGAIVFIHLIFGAGFLLGWMANERRWMCRVDWSGDAETDQGADHA